jgi:hypothetical protein
MNSIFKTLSENKIEGKFCIVEGPDFSGKSTFIKNSITASDFGTRNFMSNRGYLTNIVYARLYERTQDLEKQYDALYKQLNSNQYLMFLLLPDEETLVSRLSRGDDFIYEEKDVRDVRKLFYKEYKKISNSSNVFAFINNKWTNEELLKDDQNEILWDWRILIDTLYKRKGLYDYNLSYVFKGDKIPTIQQQLKAVYNNLEKNVYNKFLNKNYRDTYKKDVYDQMMLFSQLQFNSHIQMDVFNEDKNSRRFIASNNTSCLSNYQINVAYDNDFHISTVFRSSDAVNLLLHDIDYILQNAIQFYLFLSDYHKKIDLKKIEDTKFYFNIHLNNVHVRKF